MVQLGVLYYKYCVIGRLWQSCFVPRRCQETW